MFAKCFPSISRIRSASLSLTPVDQDLALTPSQMMSLTERGVPVSVSNSSVSLTEGVKDPFLPIERHRGVDAADVWNAENDAAESLHRGKKKIDEYYE